MIHYYAKLIRERQVAELRDRLSKAETEGDKYALAFAISYISNFKYKTKKQLAKMKSKVTKINPQ